MFAFAENAAVCEGILSNSNSYAILVDQNTNTYIMLMSWNTEFRGTLLLCTTTAPCESKLPFGYAVGTIELVKTLKAPGSQDSFIRYIWTFKNPRFIEPFYVKGNARLFEVNCEPKYIKNTIDTASNLYKTLHLTSDLQRNKILERSDSCYYYHPIYKYYLLSDIVRKDEKGNPIHPNYTTDIKPPDERNNIRMTAVFNESEKKWTVCEDNFPKPQIKIFCYKPICNIDKISVPRLIDFPNGSEYISVTGETYDINNLFCPLRFMGASFAKLRFLSLIEITNRKIFELYQQHSCLAETHDMFSFYEYHFTIDEIVHNLKKIFDVLIVEIYLKINLLNFIKTKEIVFDSIGDLMNVQNHKHNLDALRKSLFYEKYENMYKILRPGYN